MPASLVSWECRLWSSIQNARLLGFRVYRLGLYKWVLSQHHLHHCNYITWKLLSIIAVTNTKLLVWLHSTLLYSTRCWSFLVISLCLQWEQRCLELVAEKQMALDTAVIPRSTIMNTLSPTLPIDKHSHCRDTKISHLERLLMEDKDTIKELREGKLHYMALYHEADKKVARLDSRLAGYIMYM